MSLSKIRIATRKSALALWQAHYVKDALLQKHPHLTIELVPMSTQGDKILDTPLAKIGGKGLFIKELEVAMQNGQADIAVHSMKDVPVEFPDGFGLHCICERENPYDAFVSNVHTSFEQLPMGAKVGTSSLRRQAQLRAIRPDLLIKDLRGNVNTRLQKLDDGQYDAIILASAGLIRLDMKHRITQALPPELSLPAVGQGAVGIECLSNNQALIDILHTINDPKTHLRVTAERAMNAQLQGGCQVPIGGFCNYDVDSKQLSMVGLVASTDGSKVLKEHQSVQCEIDDSDTARQLGQQIAIQLLAKGAQEILAAL